MLTLALLSLAQAATWTVDPSGGGDATTIVDGVALLSDGDTLDIAPGTYDVMHVYVVANDVLIEGAGWDSTVFSGNGVEEGWDNIGFGVQGEGVVVEGIDFHDYSSVDNFEIAVEIAGDVTVEGCAFTGDYIGILEPYYGYEDLSVYDTIFAQNDTAIYAPTSLDTLHVENNLFIDNTAGLTVTDENKDMVFNRIEFVNNTFVGGGGIGIGGTNIYGTPDDAQVSIVNNLFSAVDSRWWLCLEGPAGMTADIRNNVYPASAVEEFPCNDDNSTYTETDNLEADPLLVAWSDDGDWTNDDLHQVAGSPGIDVGADGYTTLNTDFDGVARPIDGDGDSDARLDAGAYEFCPETVCGGDGADTGAPADTGDSGGAGIGAPPDAEGSTFAGAHAGCSTSASPCSGTDLVVSFMAMVALRRRQRGRSRRTTDRSR